MRIARRVLLLHDYGTASGGAELLALRMREVLRDRGRDARLLTSRARPGGLPTLADTTCAGTTGPPRRVLQAFNPFAAAAVRRELRRFRPDIVHVHMFMTQLSPLAVAPLRGVRTVLHLHNYDLICPINTKTLPDGSPCPHRAGRACWQAGCVSALALPRLRLQQHLLDMSVFDRIIANSAWVRRRVEAEGVTVHGHIWNGVPVRPASARPAPQPCVAFAGRLFWKKGVDVLLEAMRRVVDVRSGVTLNVLGDGPELPRLRAQCTRLGLDHAVRWLGFRPREQAEDVLAEAWVQVVPSRWEEPFGLVAAESMMRGTAVVASDAGGLTEQVEHGVSGLLFRPGDPAELAAAILRILDDRALAGRFGRAGRERALRHFSDTVMMDRWIEVYDEVTAAGPPAASFRSARQ